MLPRETLLHVVEHFPAAAIKMRKAGAFLALRRHVIELAKSKRQEQVLSGDMLDQMYDASSKRGLSSTQGQAVQMSLALENSAAEGSGGSPAPPRAGGVAVAEAERKVEEMQVAIRSLQEQQAEVLQVSMATKEQMKALQASVAELTRAVTAKQQL